MQTIDFPLVIAAGHPADFQRGPHGILSKKTNAQEALNYLSLSGILLPSSTTVCATPFPLHSLRNHTPNLRRIVLTRDLGEVESLRPSSDQPSEEQPWQVFLQDTTKIEIAFSHQRADEKISSPVTITRTIGKETVVEADPNSSSFRETLDAIVLALLSDVDIDWDNDSEDCTSKAPLWWTNVFIDLVDLVAEVLSPAAACKVPRTVGVLDVKLGKWRHHPRTPAKKLAKIMNQEEGLLVQRIGVRLCGGAIVHTLPDSLEALGKHVGHSFSSEDEFKTFLSSFFARCGKTSTSRITQKLHAHLTSLLHDIDAINNLREGPSSFLNLFACVSTSLLIIVTSPLPSEEDQPTVVMRWIDWARSGRRDRNYAEKDVGFYEGLTNFTSMIWGMASIDE